MTERDIIFVTVVEERVNKVVKEIPKATIVECEDEM
jgi:uncharacterized FlaG/YvyC family protein